MDLKELSTRPFWTHEDRLVVTSKKEVDNYVAAPFYVFARDEFLSGWGKARSRHSIIIIPCLSREVARMVETACNREPDLSHVVFRDHVPYFDKKDHYELFNAIRGPRFFGLTRSSRAKNVKLLEKHNVPF
jgi:hypothetical protein